LESAYYLLRRGKELLKEGEPAQAALVLEKARSYAPGKGSILEPLAIAYFSYGQYPEALDRFLEATEVDPTNDYAHYCAGVCLLKMGKKNEAKKHFKIAWFLRPREEYMLMARRFGIESKR